MLLLSSNSKNTRSGLTTLSFLNHAGKTSFFNKFSWELFKDFVNTTEATNESVRPAKAETIKNFPFQETLFATKLFKLAILLTALCYVKLYPIWDDGSSVEDYVDDSLISSFEVTDFRGVGFGEVVLVSVGFKSFSLFVDFFKLNHWRTS